MHHGLAGRFDDQIRAHIEAYASGPADYREEAVATSSNRARNIAFELHVMEKLVGAGIELDFGIATDIAAKFDGRSILFECKRPQSSRKVEAAVRYAFKQLERKYGEPVRVRHRGIIALDITKVVNPDFMLYVQPDAVKIDAGTANMVDSFLNQNARFWQTSRNRKTIAVLVKLSMMGVNQEKDEMLTYVQQHAVTPLNHAGARNIATAKALTDAMEVAHGRAMAAVLGAQPPLLSSF